MMNGEPRQFYQNAPGAAFCTLTKKCPAFGRAFSDGKI
jgi:hypothetical protein